MFEGHFVDGAAESSDGLYIYPDGSYYKGNVSKNKANGKGKFVFQN